VPDSRYLYHRGSRLGCVANPIGNLVSRRSFAVINASGLNLVVAAIILWNTVYLAKAIEYLMERGEAIFTEQVKHISPVAWDHISLTGDYIWNFDQRRGLTDLRPGQAHINFLEINNFKLLQSLFPAKY
jgi:hypothetical protein